MSKYESILDKLWGVANAITTFAAIQGLTLTLSIGTTNFRYLLRDNSISIYVMLCVAIGSVIYVMAVLWCKNKAIALLESLDTEESLNREVLIDLWRKTSFGRVIAIIFFGLISLIVIAMIFFGFWRTELPI